MLQPVPISELLKTVETALESGAIPVADPETCRILIARVRALMEHWVQFKQQETSLCFELADACNALERALGENYAPTVLHAIADAYGLSWHTLLQNMRVAKLFPPDTRLPGFRFSTYRRIAELDLGTRDWHEKQRRAHHALRELRRLQTEEPILWASLSEFQRFRHYLRAYALEQGWLEPSPTPAIPQTTPEPTPQTTPEPNPATNPETGSHTVLEASIVSDSEPGSELGSEPGSATVLEAEPWATFEAVYTYAGYPVRVRIECPVTIAGHVQQLLSRVGWFEPCADDENDVL